MDDQRSSRLEKIRHRRVWHSKCVDLANLIQNASKTCGLPTWYFVKGFNQTDKEQIIKILIAREEHERHHQSHTDGNTES